MATIYKSEKGKADVLSLYDKQLQRLSVPYREIYVETSFGQTHIIETGDMSAIPLLVFHGGNATSAYNLLACDFLLNDFHIYAVDTIGHPGKSAEVSLSHKNYDYGKWASEVISALKYERIACFAGSYGAGILAKLMCVSPKKVDKAVLYVPSGIKNAPAINSISMMIPMIMYWITHKRKWFEACIMPMAITRDNITEDIFQTAKSSIDNAKIKTGMPSNVNPEDMRKCLAPTFVLAGEYDCLFPGKNVLAQAEKIIPNCRTYLLNNRGHMNKLTPEEKKAIVNFLL